MSIPGDAFDLEGRGLCKALVALAERESSHQAELPHLDHIESAIRAPFFSDIKTPSQSLQCSFNRPSAHSCVADNTLRAHSAYHCYVYTTLPPHSITTGLLLNQS